MSMVRKVTLRILSSTEPTFQSWRASLAHVAVISRSGAFAEDWTILEGEILIAAQVSRDGLEIILYHDESRTGGGRIFMSLKPGDVMVFAR
jgi:hypothetical protein